MSSPFSTPSGEELFEDRKKAFEAKFRREQEAVFRINTRRDRLFGLVVAETLGLAGDKAELYARAMVEAVIAGGTALTKAGADLRDKGLAVDEAVLRRQWVEAEARARIDILGPDAA